MMANVALRNGVVKVAMASIGNRALSQYLLGCIYNKKIKSYCYFIY